jgi:hypothetical protein
VERDGDRKREDQIDELRDGKVEGFGNGVGWK